jgi:hypothetical protein
MTPSLFPCTKHHTEQIHKHHKAARSSSEFKRQPSTITMIRDSTLSRLNTAVSCFEANDPTKDLITGENMTQPLNMTNAESLEDEEHTKLSKERQSIIIICKSLLLGSSSGFAVKVISFAAYHAIKMFGEDSKPSTVGSHMSSFSYWALVLISLLDFAIHVATWLAFMYTITKSGSLYVRKKFDKDAANPNSGSIWTTRMLLVAEICFHFGYIVGVSLWIMIVDLRKNTAIQLMPLLTSMMIDFFVFLAIVKCFDSSRTISRGYTKEQELEDVSCFIL